MYFLSFTSMKKTFFASLLLMAAMQTVKAQMVVLHKTDGQTIECSVSQLDSISFDEHEWVDLGLPSGTLWATCNVGANSPEQYGDYFAWGETEPKEDYSWSTYKYCNGSYTTLTKYCKYSDYGYNSFTDTLAELLLEDDAATVNWGSGWQMPSPDQIEELYNNTTTTWTTQGGVNGRLCIASNGNSIFLPAAGSRNGTSLDGAGSYGKYWLRSLSTLYSYDAYYLLFNSDSFGWSNYRRYYGRSIRPVRVKTR